MFLYLSTFLICMLLIISNIDCFNLFPIRNININTKHVNNKHMTFSMKPSVIAIALGFLLPSFEILNNQLYSTTNLIVHADSTGKMSTKLTARKRYLPRIKTGITLYQELMKNPSKESINSFIIDEVPGLKRAMNLYGASLRKGEVPDEISRKAEILTDNFIKEILKLEKSSDVNKQLDIAYQNLLEYINFSKIE